MTQQNKVGLTEEQKKTFSDLFYEAVDIERIISELDVGTSGNGAYTKLVTLVEHLLAEARAEGENRGVKENLRYGDGVFQINLGSALRGLKKILKRKMLIESDLETIDDIVTYFGMYEDREVANLAKIKATQGGVVSFTGADLNSLTVGVEDLLARERSSFFRKHYRSVLGKLSKLAPAKEGE